MCHFGPEAGKYEQRWHWNEYQECGREEQEEQSVAEIHSEEEDTALGMAEGWGKDSHYNFQCGRPAVE